MRGGPRDQAEIRDMLEELLVEAAREGARFVKARMPVQAVKKVNLSEMQKQAVQNNIRTWIVGGSLEDHLDLDDLVSSLEAELATLRRTVLDRGDPATPALIVERMGTVGWRVAVNPRAVERVAEAVRDGWSR